MGPKRPSFSHQINMNGLSIHYSHSSLHRDLGTWHRKLPITHRIIATEDQSSRFWLHNFFLLHQRPLWRWHLLCTRNWRKNLNSYFSFVIMAIEKRFTNGLYGKTFIIMGKGDRMIKMELKSIYKCNERFLLKENCIQFCVSL